MYGRACARARRLSQQDGNTTINAVDITDKRNIIGLLRIGLPAQTVALSFDELFESDGNVEVSS